MPLPATPTPPRLPQLLALFLRATLALTRPTASPRPPFAVQREAHDPIRPVQSDGRCPVPPRTPPTPPRLRWPPIRVPPASQRSRGPQPRRALHLQWEPHSRSTLRWPNANPLTVSAHTACDTTPHPTHGPPPRHARRMARCHVTPDPPYPRPKVTGKAVSYAFDPANPFLLASTRQRLSIIADAAHHTARGSTTWGRPDHATERSVPVLARHIQRTTSTTSTTAP